MIKDHQNAQFSPFWVVNDLFTLVFVLMSQVQTIGSLPSAASANQFNKLGKTVTECHGVSYVNENSKDFNLASTCKTTLCYWLHPQTV